ncbi:divergent polysaccharide deacetylase family protein [uncultured Aliiroseovarius sp.]|uniref:divergent polysaccharide deacetylase family protein n=1 Tax=uncultured Aliiroseovarius sp. TaxID=1658783 RepID=UPI0026349B87|nr:divergent polysaccharide deacetylase family protein [uncultured Aliiroseovarius sp.]
MPKGFLSGVLWGSVVSVLGLGVVSLQLDPVSMKPSTVPVAETLPEPDTDTASDADAPEATETAPADIAAPESALDDAAVEPAPDTGVEPSAAPGALPGASASIDAAPVETEGPAAAPIPAETPSASAADTPATAPDAPVEETTPPDADAPAQSIPELANTPQIRSEPVAPIKDQADGVTTNRLPTIEAAPTEEEGTDAPDAAEAQLLTDTLSLAIMRNAESFADPEGRPLMSVVLLDQGEKRRAMGDLNNLPFPVSFIVDASASDASQAIAFYRAAGAEVIVEPVLPPNATPTDAEVNLQVQAPLLDQAVAIYMDHDSGFQSDSQLAAQIAAILAASGHGLVTQPQGLNTGHKTALKTGVASGLVFRDLDSEGQDGKVIRRFMDNAAFKAGQEGGVIMFGRANVETVQALIEWSLGNRVKSVAMAPVSAILLGN